MARRSREDAEESILRELGGWIVYILLIIGLTYFIITFVGQRTRVSGSSMETTLQNGDNLIVDKISYRFRDPKRYDIIVFPYKYEENTYYIKRIIGMPGETVQIKDGYVYIDGERLLSDIYGNELIKDPQTAADPITLKENEYFVMGDNRNHSMDSRDPSVGVLTKEDLIGRAWVRIYPFDNIGVTVMNKREEEKLKRQQEKLKKELERTEAMSVYEKEHSDCQYICGIDEVGRGPFAGPVVAGAVILPKDDPILYLNDSKKLSEKKREALYDEIMERAVATGIGVVSPARIDEINILQATYEAMRMAIGNLKVQPDLLLNDAVTIPEVEIPQVPIIKGDAKSVSIAAASIIAKVTRDRLMVEYDKVLPGYDFASNKGYGTKKHIEGLKELGPSPIHRRTFIKKYI